MDVPEVTVDWRSKGFWLPDGPRTASSYTSSPAGLRDGGFTWPVMVVRRSAVETNIATMAAYCQEHGFDFAPHAKTTMAPGLIEAQFQAGAWGMTVATPNQALVLRRLGAPRVLIANEVLDPSALAWLAAENAAGWEVYLQVDSLAGVAAAAAVPSGLLRVLVELGHAEGRTGVRTVKDLEVVAQAVTASDRLTLAGVTAYEGQLPDQASVDAFLDTLVAGFDQVSSLLPARPILSAGGSAWFDRVVERLSGLDAQLVLRSGASVTHDDGFYRAKTPFNRVASAGPLNAALEIWAQVLSTPEAGLAIVGMGKRDAPFDEGLPVVRAVLPAASADSVPTAATSRSDISEMSVMKLNDHHAYVADPGSVLGVGDLVRFGISHPCTAFDKWRHIPVIDDNDQVVDVVETYF